LKQLIKYTFENAIKLKSNLFTLLSAKNTKTQNRKQGLLFKL